MVQDPGELSLGLQEHPPCHDFHVMLSWYASCEGFQRCLAEPSMLLSTVSEHVCIAVAVQVIGDSHLPGGGCDEHVGLVIFCAGEGLCEVV